MFEHEPLPLDDPLLALDNVIAHAALVGLDDRCVRRHEPGHGRRHAARRGGEVPADIVNREVLEQPGFRAKLARFEENRGAIQSERNAGLLSAVC